MNERELWEKCAAFHGHECGGLTIGYKAALYAIELLDLHFSDDEQVVCITENDACGVDAIQVHHRPLCTAGAEGPASGYEPPGVLCLLPVPRSQGHVCCKGDYHYSA